MKNKIDYNSDWNLDPAPESIGHIKLKSKYDLFIGGKWVKPKAGKYFATINPATEQQIADIAEAGARGCGRSGKSRKKGI